MKKMKICFLIAGFSEGGAQKQCIYLLNELQKDQTLEIDLIFFYEGVNFYSLDIDNITTWNIKLSSFYNPVNIFRIAKVIRQVRPDVLISWLHASDVYSYFLKQIFKNIKWIMTERDSYYPLDIRYLIRNFAGSNADLVVANSLKGKQYWINKGLSNSKVKIISNILVEPKTSIQNSIKDDRYPIIIYAGRFEPQKNILTVAQAFCELSSIYPNGHFYIIGQGSLKDKVLDIVKLYKKENYITILPFQKNIYEYFSMGDVFVNISYHEGTPNTVIENISLNKLVLVSHIPEHIDLLGENYPYMLRNLNNIEEIILMVKSMLVCDSTLDLLSYARERLLNMSPELIANNYKNLFKEVCHD